MRTHGLPTERIEQNDVLALHGAARRCVSAMREGAGPAFIECMTYRWLEHCGPLEDIHLGYRTQAEFDAWLARCPLRLQRTALEGDGLLDAPTHAAWEAEIAVEIDDAVGFAQQSPFPKRSELTRHMYATVSSAHERAAPVRDGRPQCTAIGRDRYARQPE